MGSDTTAKALTHRIAAIKVIGQKQVAMLAAGQDSATIDVGSVKASKAQR